uniref:chitinase n=1 Tax=Zea mays TaxID=4577 RepID=A0A3G1VV79_MAIZE|nr:chitinase 2 [Zea mays]AYK28280.1 chitinase 2 [Zea mays]AYK28281.1 chitinase 2 [Zea mays]AYK28284.1 chitinase 2 [Zea mays]
MMRALAWWPWWPPPYSSLCPLAPSSAGRRPAARCAPTACAAASSGGAAAPPTTAAAVARASAAAAAVAPRTRRAAAAWRPSSPSRSSTRCCCTATTRRAPPTASTPTRASSRRPTRSRASAPRGRPTCRSASWRLAALLAQTSHETTGGWATAPDGPYAWGYCFKGEQGGASGPDYCEPSAQWPCAAGKKYYGRGPIQISYNYNYGPAGQAIGAGILANPDLVATDPTVSFETAVWFWMTPQSPKPSCHDVMTGQWTPSAADTAAGRLPGYGVVTNIINGGLECGHGADSRVADRIGFYKRYCDLLGVSYGDNLDCANQTPFNG